MQPNFLTIDDVFQIHHHQIERYGGEPSLRDPGLLDSALAMPRQSFGGRFVHEFPAEMAAAYLFHIVKNHAFVDGNKRTGLAAALAFLELNGYELVAEKPRVEAVVLGVASSEITKAQAAEWIRSSIRRR